MWLTLKWLHERYKWTRQMQCQWPTALRFRVPDGTVLCFENLANQSVLKTKDIAAGKRKKTPKPPSNQPKPRGCNAVFSRCLRGSGGAGRGGGRCPGCCTAAPAAGGRAGGGAALLPLRPELVPLGPFWFVLVAEREPSDEQVQPSGSRVCWCARTSVHPEACTGETRNSRRILCDHCNILLDFLVFYAYFIYKAQSGYSFFCVSKY